jgi:hypothetical protein
MAVKPGLSIKASEPDQVDSYMRKLKHPLADVAGGAEANHFEYGGRNRRGNQMERPSLLLHGSYEAVQPEGIQETHCRIQSVSKRLCTARASERARIGDTSGLLEGDYADGRRLAFFSYMADIESKAPALQRAIRKWLTLLDRG